MATKKPKAPQPGPRLTKNQRELKALAKAGLYKGDWKHAKDASGAQKRLRAKFKEQMPDLIAGKVKAVKVPKGAKLSSGLPVARGKTLVRAEKGERVTYSKKTGTFGSIVYRDGVKLRRIILPMEPESVGALLHRKGLFYQVPFKQMGVDSPMFSDPEELAKFMAEYEKGTKPRFPDWLNYVEVYEAVNVSDTDEVATYD